MNRKSQKNTLVVAHAPSRALFWVGCLKEPQIEFLQELEYGGASDWQVWRTFSGGKVLEKEWQLLGAVEHYVEPHPTEAGGLILPGQDLVACSSSQMEALCQKVLGARKSSEPLPAPAAASERKERSARPQPPAPPQKPASLPTHEQQDARFFIRCPHCQKVYRVPWRERPTSYRCARKSCRQWFRTALTSQAFLHDQLYVDIETTGLSPAQHQVTSIVWWSQEGGWGHWVQSEIPPAVFQRAWRHARQVVTFNGKAFDEPFLVQHLSVAKHEGHVDLRHMAAEQGHKGGLKKICEAWDLRSPAYLDQVSGREAIHFWQQYQRTQDPLWRKRLLHYNAWDVVMTYRLHQQLQGRPIAPIEASMPFERA